MGKTALKKFIKFEEAADDKTIKQACLTKMEDEAAAAMEGDDAYNYEEAAGRLEEMAKAYEDSKLSKDDDDGEEPHVAMRRYAAKFRKMSAPKLEGDAGGKDKDDKEAKDKDAAFERVKVAELSVFASRMGVKLSAGMSSKQILDAIEASTVPSSELPKLIDARVQTALREQEQRATAQNYEARAKELVALCAEMPDNQKAAIERLASDPKHFEAARGMVDQFIRGTGGVVPDTTMLMSRMTMAGAPIGLPAVTARGSAPSAGSDARVVKMELLGDGGRALVTGEKLSTAVKAMADSADPATAARVDRELEPGMKGTMYESYGRYLAAERLLKKDNPSLFEAAKTDQVRLF